MNAEDQNVNSPNQPKSRPAPEFLGLSRCAACYNQQAISRRGGDGESSSSAEDSGPEGDCESEAESSSSSSCSGRAPSEVFEEPEIEKHTPVSGDAAEPESGGKDGDGREETLESREDKSRTKAVTQRAPLVKSYSLPASFTPRLAPLTLLPRPHTVVSTLHLQVLSQEHDNNGFHIIRQHKSEREEIEESTRGGQYGVNLPPPHTGLPWQPTLQQHQLSYQHQQQPHQLSHQLQQQQPQHFPLISAPGQRLPPTLHTLPVFHPPTLHAALQAPNAPHLQAITPQPCWYCYSMQSPYSPYWSHYSGGQLPR